jgi:hypothetical protein
MNFEKPLVVIFFSNHHYHYHRRYYRHHHHIIILIIIIIIINLDQFLAETSKSEMRAMHAGKPLTGSQGTGSQGIPGTITPNGSYMPRGGGTSSSGNWREKRT